MNRVTYSIHGLCANHSAVLRSMVLLSEKNVGCAWQINAEPNADVLFLGEAAKADDFYPRPGQILVSVGDSSEKQTLHLDLPLLFPRVAKLLANITQTALSEQALRPASGSGLQPSVYNLGFLPPSTKHDDIPASGQLYKLKTWPPAGVIGNNRSYMRAAAVLTGKSLTSSQLAEKTSLPLGDCRQFIGKLDESRCLDIAAPGSTPSAPGFIPTAGISPAARMAAMPSSASSTASIAAPLLTPTANSAVSGATNATAGGLFSRIRSRLGFLGKTAS